MYKADRLNAIVAYLETHQKLDVDTAMRIFEASTATIRRDFSQLVASGRVVRGPNEVRRLPRFGMGIDQPVAVREIAMRREKDAIGRRAASMIRDEDVVFIDGGTTTYAMVRHCAERKLHIITPCIRIANLLNELRYDNNGLEVVMPGGILLAHSYVLYGPHTCSYLESYSAQWAFIGVDGTDGENLFSVNEFVSSTQRAMIANSRHTVLLADHSKFGRPSRVRTAELNENFTIVTDNHESSRDMVEQVQKKGGRVVYV